MEIETIDMSFPERILLGLKRLERDKLLFQGAFRDWAGPEGLTMTLVRHGVEVIPSYIRRMHGKGAVTDEVVRLVRFYVEGVVSELAHWIAATHPIPPEAFRDFLIAAMPMPLCKLLLETKPRNRKDHRK